MTDSPEQPTSSPTRRIDTRRYQWLIGGLGVALLVAFAVFLYANSSSDGPGIPVGGQIRPFVAPLAASTLTAAADTNPDCDPNAPARRGLNVCGQAPIVLAFFTTSRRDCVRSVGALQRVASEFPGTQFGAVAVGADHREAAKLVRRHRWQIPVAYDMSGAVGALYDVAVCPLIQVANQGGVVTARLVGDSWASRATLSARLAQLLR